MSHKSIRLLIEDTAKSLATDIQFTYATPNDFNVLRDKKYPFISLSLLTATPQFTENGVTFLKAWNCSMAFYQLDIKGSSPEHKALILDEVGNLVDKFINKLNLYSSQADTIVIQGISQQAFVEAMADILTGHLLSFTILAQDDFDYCADDLDCGRTDECGNN
jgi:hypothetical protein